MGHVTYQVEIYFYWLTQKDKCGIDSKLLMEECLIMQAGRSYFIS